MWWPLSLGPFPGLESTPSPPGTSRGFLLSTLHGEPVLCLLSGNLSLPQNEWGPEGCAGLSHSSEKDRMEQSRRLSLHFWLHKLLTKVVLG